MKNTLLILLCFCCTNLFAQSPTGNWMGKLDAGITLRMIFSINGQEGAYKASLTSIDQSPDALEADSVSIINDSVYIDLKHFRISYRGKFMGDSIVGLFRQGRDFPMNLYRVKDEEVAVKRPQEPKPPFDYEIREVKFLSGNKKDSLAGTLTLPKFKKLGKPAVVMITGSGPQDRDETILNHKPFWVIADRLTKAGYAVLRYDDRGIGKSGGDFSTATSLDFAEDAIAAVHYLKSLPETGKVPIGLIGHSEGGMIAPMVDKKTKDIAFSILLAAPAVDIVDLMKEQVKAVAKTKGFSDKLAAAAGDVQGIMLNALNDSKDEEGFLKKAQVQLANLIRKNDTATFKMLNINPADSGRAYLKSVYKSLDNKWYRYFADFEPEEYIEDMKGNVLALYGEKDLQVDAAINHKAMEKALKDGKGKFKQVMTLPGLNHLFQTCNSCGLEEYGTLEETFSPTALNIMVDWLNKIYGNDSK